MKTRIRNFILMAIVVAAGYGAMSYHIVFDGWDVPYFLEKTSLHLHETFFSISQKKPETIMREEHLCSAGIGQLLVDLGEMSQEDKYRLENKFCPDY